MRTQVGYGEADVLTPQAVDPVVAATGWRPGTSACTDAVVLADGGFPRLFDRQGLGLSMSEATPIFDALSARYPAAGGHIAAPADQPTTEQLAASADAPWQPASGTLPPHPDRPVADPTDNRDAEE